MLMDGILDPLASASLRSKAPGMCDEYSRKKLKELFHFIDSTFLLQRKLKSENNQALSYTILNSAVHHVIGADGNNETEKYASTKELQTAYMQGKHHIWFCKT